MKYITFTNRDGKKLKFKETATLAELVKLGVKDVFLHPKNKPVRLKKGQWISA